MNTLREALKADPRYPNPRYSAAVILATQELLRSDFAVGEAEFRVRTKTLEAMDDECFHKEYQRTFVEFGKGD